MKGFEELKEKYSAGIAHTFIFYGNTFDFAHNHMFLKTYLVHRFTKMSRYKKNIIFYDKSDGLDFPTPSDREAFMSALADDLADYGGMLPKDTTSVFNLIGKAIKKDHFALIVDYAETVFPEGDLATLSEYDRTAIVSVLKWAKDTDQIKNMGNPIVLISSTLSRIHSMLREPSSRIEAIGIPYPDTKERKEFIETTLSENEEKGNPLTFDEKFDSDFMSRATAGLAKTHIVDIIQRAKLKNKSVISLPLVRERKNEIIKAEFHEVLQVIEPEHGFDLIGCYDYVKEFLRKNVIQAVRCGNLLRVPLGILFMGPSGTGKTVFAQALAHECGINFISWNLSRVLNRWVGSSEENMEKSIWAIKSIRPVIVFIDELDTAVSRGNRGDSNVSNHITKYLLEFMSDTRHRGEIIFLAATNKPEDIDFALKRTGRFDKKIPILPPSIEEMPEIYMSVFSKYSIKTSVTADELKSLTSVKTSWHNHSNMVGSDIVEIVRKAYEISEDAGKKIVDIQDVQIALNYIKPSTQDIEAMVASAIRECTDLSLLPEAYRNKYAAASQSAEEKMLERDL